MDILRVFNQIFYAITASDQRSDTYAHTFIFLRSPIDAIRKTKRVREQVRAERSVRARVSSEGECSVRVAVWTTNISNHVST